MYKRRSPPEEDLFVKPQIISLADVTLCLLVIVLSTAGAATQFIDVTLPEARNTASRDVNLAVTLTVTRAGSYYFEDEKTPIGAKNLWAALREIKGGSSWAMALVRADQQARWEDVELLTQCLQGLGVDEICYQTKEGSE